MSEPEKYNTEVISLGLSGIGPAHYLELLKYASKYFDPDEVIIFVTLGNDFTNLSYKVQNNVSPKEYIYYQIDGSGNLKMHQESIVAQKRFAHTLEANHYPLFYTFGKIVVSHSMIRNVMKTLLMNMRNKEVEKEETSHNELRGVNKEQLQGDSDRENEEQELRLLGIDEFVFRKDSSREAKDAIDIATGLLRMCKEYAASQGITVRVVTIPLLPNRFYTRYHTRHWSLETESHDFLLPEKSLVEFAEKHKIPILPMGSYMYDNHLLPSQIKELYLTWGRGHLSENGHKYFAEALYDFFYSY